MAEPSKGKPAYRRTSKTGPREDTSWHDKFLQSLAKRGLVQEACIEAKVSSSCAYEHRDKHPDFAGAWDEAQKVGNFAIEAEMYKRALEGEEIPVFDNKGNIVSTYRKKSDRLLQTIAAAKMPETYGRQRHELTGPGGGPVETASKVDEAQLDRAVSAMGEVIRRMKCKPA